VTRDTSRRPAPPGFWDSLPGALTIIGLLALVALVVVVRDRTAHRMTAEVTSCEFQGSVVKVALLVRNNGRDPGPAEIAWSYRDARGNTFTAAPVTVANVSPGRSVTHEATATLETPSATGTCEITAVK
jgi:hypothetical protein